MHAASLWFLAGVAAIAICISTPALVFYGPTRLVRLLGEDNCLSLNGMDWGMWLGANMLLGVAAIAFAVMLLGPWWFWALLPIGPMLGLTLLGLAVRCGEPGSRQKEFFLGESGIIDRRGNPIRATFVQRGMAYLCTGPGSGYCLFWLSLGSESDSELCGNGYVSADHFDRDLARLQNVHGLLGFDLVFVCEDDGDKLLSVHFGAEWTPVMCRGLGAAPESTRAFWHGLLTPGLATSGPQPVDNDELLTHLNAIEQVYLAEMEAGSRYHRDCAALRCLIDQAGPRQVWAMTSQAHVAHIKALSDGGRTSTGWEDGVVVTTSQPAAGR